MAVLLIFAVAEYVGFQGWCSTNSCCRSCRPSNCQLCSMRHRAEILTIQHEMLNTDYGYRARPNVLVTFKCRSLNFKPRVGEFCFLGIADHDDNVLNEILVGNSFHPFTVFPLAEDHVYGVYFHTGLDERTGKCLEYRGGWCFSHFGESVANQYFESPEHCESSAVAALSNKKVYVVGGFPSELANPSFTRARHLFCTCVGAGVTPFISLAADVYKNPKTYSGKIITVVRSASHPLFPEFLRQFGFQYVSLRVGG